jgi:hypothetical protein
MQTEISNQKLDIGHRTSDVRWVILVSACVVALASVPYLVVYLTTPPDLRFVGALINPYDGDSYFAKMQIGAQGGWLFSLMYTAQDHPDVLLFSFHILLGHVSAWTHLPIPLVYHAVRILAGFGLLLVVYALIARVIEDVTGRRIAFLMAALSSGLGWLALIAGHTETADLVIPESNTFYSLQINAHFALAMALMTGMFLMFMDRRSEVTRTAALSVASLALAIVQPFAVAPVYLTLGVTWLLCAWRDRRVAWRGIWPVVIAGLVTLPLTLYTFWVTQANPVLGGWTAQNLTPSPPVWDYALGYGVILVLAVPGVSAAVRRRSDADLLLLAWVAVTALLLYAPFALQRRFSLGLHIPLAILAARGLWQWTRRRLVIGLVFASTLLTTLLILLLAVVGGLQRDARLFVSADEAAAMDWLKINSPRQAIVLASPEMGLFIPAWAGRRVVYGHPFETVDAEQTRARVEAFFATSSDAERQAMLREWRAAFVFIGPRERKLGLTGSWGGREVYRNPTVVIVQP